MGYSLSWLAVKGKAPQAARDELRFHPTGKWQEIPAADLSAVEMPNGWYLIVSNHSDQVGSDAALQRLSSSGCELVTCFIEEHVMVSKATGWKDGRRIWLVMHDAQINLQHLDIQGEPPQGFAAIREKLLAMQTPQSCDYIFDVPVETARSIIGYRHDQDVPGLSGEVFEVLAKKSTFLRRLFGS
jgi:hypothetical protein